jgi:class 3 adenylate cyclase
MSSTENRSQRALARQPLGSALFCDLVGFTPLTERLDAETVERVQRD